MSNYSLEARERKVRKKANAAGYKVRKGFTHWLQWNTVYTNMTGERFIGYEVWDLSINQAVLGIDNNFDYNATLEEVERFIKTIYEENGLAY